MQSTGIRECCARANGVYDGLFGAVDALSELGDLVPACGRYDNRAVVVGYEDVAPGWMVTWSIVTAVWTADTRTRSLPVRMYTATDQSG